MFGVSALRERVALLEKEVDILRNIVAGAVPVAFLDKNNTYVFIVPEDTSDDECTTLTQVFQENRNGVVIKGSKFKLLEVSDG